MSSFIKRMDDICSRFGEVSWCAEDVQELRPDWAIRACNIFLDATEDRLQLDMITQGWRCLTRELGMYERSATVNSNTRSRKDDTANS